MPAVTTHDEALDQMNQAASALNRAAKYWISVGEKRLAQHCAVAFSTIFDQAMNPSYKPTEGADS